MTRPKFPFADLAAPLRRFRGDRDGLAAIEFAMIAGFLSVAVLNVSDVAVFMFDQLQVNNSAQMGVQAAWAACDLNHLPAATRCPGMDTAIGSAIQTTSLGSSVALQSGYPTEGYYCANSSGALQYVSDVSSRPADCSSVGVPTGSPGDYVEVQTTYSYSPIFPGLSVASVFPSTITSTAWVRLGP